MSQPQPAPADPAAPAARDGLFARQAIVDLQRKVVGYALVDRASWPASASRDADFLLHLATVANNADVTDSLTLFARCRLETLSGDHLDLIAPNRLVLEVELPAVCDAAKIAGTAALLQSLRKRGFQLAFDHQALAPAWRSWLAHASYVRVDLDSLPAGVVEPLIVQALRLPGIELIASRIQTAAQHRQAAALGVKLFQGRWFVEPATVPKQPIHTGQALILELIGLLQNDSPIEKLETIFQRDPVLSFNMLRFVNSAANGLRSEVTSFRQAVMVLGQKKLLRWATLLLAAAGKHGSPALSHTAVVRGRFMELLSTRSLWPQEGEHAFLVGIFSLLDAITGHPLEELLASVTLPAPVKQTLLAGEGPLADLLMAVRSCEDPGEMDAAHCAGALGLTEQAVDASHMEALAWAEVLLKGG